MIYTLQGLRALAMLGIFLFHSGLLINGTFLVTFFSFFQVLYYITLSIMILAILHLNKI